MQNLKQKQHQKKQLIHTLIILMKLYIGTIHQKYKKQLIYIMIMMIIFIGIIRQK
jgi:hypothetical protein